MVAPRERLPPMALNRCTASFGAAHLAAPVGLGNGVISVACAVRAARYRASSVSRQGMQPRIRRKRKSHLHRTDHNSARNGGSRQSFSRRAPTPHLDCPLAFIFILLSRPQISGKHAPRQICQRGPINTFNPPFHPPQYRAGKKRERCATAFRAKCGRQLQQRSRSQRSSSCLRKARSPNRPLRNISHPPF